MASKNRDKLQEPLCRYISDTLKLIETVKEFCDKEAEWTTKRQFELKKIKNIKDKIENKNQTWGQKIWNHLKKDSRRQELEKELGEVLKNTLEGLEKLHHFLDAVEKLSVTSVHVFIDGNANFMPEEVSSMSVKLVISAARIVSPLLIHFKRDPGNFFLPNLFNIEVLIFQLEKYIRVTQKICKKMQGEKMQKQLHRYISDTLKLIETVNEFCDGESKWTMERQTEIKKIKNIKDEDENKNQTWEKNKQSYMEKDSRRQKLEKELGEVLKNTLEGLEKLQGFLDAVEKLSVTSLFVFEDENKSFMPEEVSSMSVCSVILAARMVSLLLIHHIKRYEGSFFMPSIINVEALIFQLENYISVTQQICKKMEERSNNRRSSLEFNLNMTENLYDHVLQLNKIRMDESFRMNFLFDKKAQNFIELFSERHSRMVQFLSDLEEAAVQLDRMKKGSNISTVAGSSVGIAGGVLSIVGLALAPVTAGVSLALTLTGVGLGVTSGVNSLVTGITEMAVNSHQGKKANNTFVNFMEDVQMILDCMETVARTEGPVVGPQVVTTAVEVVKLAARVGALGKGIDAIVDGASAVKVLGSEEVIAKAVNLGLQEAQASRSIPKLAADLPDVGQVAKGTPVALSQSARAGFIGLNAFFIGLDVLFICKSGMSLAKGSKNEVAQLICSRAALWESEVEAWAKIHNHLFEGVSGFDKNWKTLKQHFHI
ncbi:uncharacterized protein LOC128517041 [Clarias gariepinus]|uniref:uncharacterized protein LOC128517041 n=1 Tax=Clarias gariepinus TaxID=13013 RepID=UPI00234CA450|nr:uncharacterized protein LOC128517041 [Clarias gariepinus]